MEVVSEIDEPIRTDQTVGEMGLRALPDLRV